MKRTIPGFFLLVLSAVTLIISCNKIDTTTIGDGLIPVVDNINTFDTVLDVVTDNFLFEDSTTVSAAENHALGYVSNDPVFGKITASIYAHFQPSLFGSISPFHDSIAGLDSVVLSLAYRQTFGDSNSMEQFGVYEIDQSERTNFKDSVYRIDHSPFNLNQLFTTHTQQFTRLNDVDTILEGKVRIAVTNRMRIPLSNSLTQRFLDYDTVVYRNDSTFKDKFLGIALIPDSSMATSNALAYFNLRDTATRLSFYYRAISNGKTDTFVTHFFVTGFTAANIIHRNITGTEFETAINNGTPADDKVYIATSPGSFALVRVPGLHGLSNRLIHRAELIVEQIPAAGDNIFAAPERLMLDAYDSAQSYPRTIQNDFVYDNSSTTLYNNNIFGGDVKSGKYIFNISRFVQGIVTRNDTIFPLRLYAPYTTVLPYIPEGMQGTYNLKNLIRFSFPVLPYVANGRAVVAGGNYADPTHRLRLRIIYSKI